MKYRVELFYRGEPNKEMNVEADTYFAAYKKALEHWGISTGTHGYAASINPVH